MFFRWFVLEFPLNFFLLIFIFFQGVGSRDRFLTNFDFFEYWESELCWCSNIFFNFWVTKFGGRGLIFGRYISAPALVKNFFFFDFWGFGPKLPKFLKKIGDLVVPRTRDGEPKIFCWTPNSQPRNC